MDRTPTLQFSCERDNCYHNGGNTSGRSQRSSVYPHPRPSVAATTCPTTLASGLENNLRET
jgi:hypothetical protein